MGNKHPTLNLDQGFPNILTYQKKEILKSFSKNELQFIFLLYLNLKSRTVLEGIDKESFHHFCQMPGLWGQRFWQKFQRVQGREFIEFDEFIYSLYTICRSPEDQQDRFIFDMFNLGQKPGLGQKPKKEITKEEMIAMIYNLPYQGMITSTLKQGKQAQQISDPDDVDATLYTYQIKRNLNKSSHEKLQIGQFKFLQMKPAHVKCIIDSMIDSISDNGMLTFEQFRQWLELNPAMRVIIKESVKPQLWTLNEKGYAHYQPDGLFLDTHEDVRSQSFQNPKGQVLQAKQQQSSIAKPVKIDHYKKKQKENGSISCISMQSTSQKYIASDKNEPQDLQPGEVAIEGELLKLGRKTEMWRKRYYILKDSTLICYNSKASKSPSNVIYLNGLYVETYYTKGVQGFRIFHDSEYFKEKMYYHKDQRAIQVWLNKVKQQACYYDINKKYQKMNQLGKGKFSTVYLCRAQESDEVAAMKLIDKRKLTVKEREFLREEIQIIRSISHPNVVVMIDAFETLTNMYIMMECMQGGELFDHIKDNEISEREAALITFQILEALQYLHLAGIVHRDLKPENILVERDPQTNEVHHIKITDFGLSKIIVPGEIMMDSCGTPAYVAPEVLTKNGYQKEVDIWSTGVILYTMLARALPFHSSDRKKTFKLIKEADPDLSGEPWDTISADCKDLIRKMLIKDPKVRITVDDALKQPFFRKYQKHINNVKNDYIPMIDHDTGQIKKPRKSSVSGSQTSMLSKLKSIQQSQTDYAAMVDESQEGEGKISQQIKHVPSSIGTKPFHLESGMHHMEKLDSMDSLDDDPDHKVEKVKKQRLKEIQNLGSGNNKNQLEKLHYGIDQHQQFQQQLKQQHEQDLVLHHVSTRTFQPIKGFDLGTLIQQENQQKDLGKGVQPQAQEKKKHNLVILKTHRFFSDHLDEEHELDHHL